MIRGLHDHYQRVHCQAKQQGTCNQNVEIPVERFPELAMEQVR